MKTKFYIEDWAGNDKSAYYGEFHTFEDAWGALYAEFSELEGDAYDSQLEEFYVLERGAT